MNAMSTIKYGLDMESLKKQHCNHKCISCKHRAVYAYEDDTPASYTPYHWWKGTCTELGIEIRDNVLPPDNCPFESVS